MARAFQSNTLKHTSPNKTTVSKLPKLHICYSKANLNMKILKTPFLRSQEKKVDIITHITNAHKYIADAKKMFLF